jgi:hypothetical protein
MAVLGGCQGYRLESPLENHFVHINEMVDIGSGAWREMESVRFSVLELTKKGVQ